MIRRWLNSLDVGYDPQSGAILTRDAAPGAFPGGTRQGEGVIPLLGESTPCRWVWLGARADALGNPQNTAVVFVGDAQGQNLPLLSTDIEGLMLAIDDASKIHIRTATATDGVAYRVFT